jgi:hypothetical protein
MRHLLLTLLLTLTVMMGGTTSAWQSVQRQESQPERLSSAEFSRLSQELSEEGGYFHSDNLVSNELAYPRAVEKLKQLGVSGGAYLGVGPEQNFTYIAKIRPRIAFIIDIRRQALIQHLMYKAIFHLSPNRAQFLSLLLSRPVAKGKAPSDQASIHELVEFFSQVSSSDQAFAANLTEIRKAIIQDFKFPLSEPERAGLDSLYRSFRDGGLDITYQAYSNGFRGISPSFGNDVRIRFIGGAFPTLGEVIAQTDENGKNGGFLSTKEDYEFVREMHRKNLIIPVTGDFAGPKALAAVGDYLRRHGYTLSAFYVSNVEQYLFQSNVFESFVKNVRRLPINDRSLFIRSVSSRFFPGTGMPSFRSIMLLQQMPVFIKDYDEGSYTNYYDLVTTHYIPTVRQ